MATERSAGAGGKFRKKPSRSTQSTPYDRPASALRPTSQLRQNNNNNNGWLSKLVDPASRLISAGANRLFSSVFRKRLLPPQRSPPDETLEKGDVQPEITTQVAPSGTKEQVTCRGDDSKVSENGGVAELEDILKQKTFTRSEIDHLTALLLSRTAEKSVETQTGSLELKSLGEMAVHSKRETSSYLPVLENGAGHVLPAAVSTPYVRSKVLEDAVASPAELAKAYMGSRPTRASPSVAAMQNEMQKEDLSQYNPFVKQKTPATSVIQKPANDIGASANGFMTPRFRGRSAIYSMARTPYSRPGPTEVYKAAETASDIHGVPSSAHNAAETQQFSGSKKQVLKRRSSVLESDIGFVGPIRRIRQKPNLLNHKTLSLPASGSSYVKHGYGDLADVNEVPSSSGRRSNYYLPSSKAPANNGMPSSSNGYVPSQSIEMAQKIFQQLDKFAPKGKSSEKNVDIAEGSSSGKMTSDMRDGLAHRSTNTVSSSKVVQTVQDSKKGNGLLDSVSALDHTSKISRSVEERCPNKFVVPPVDDGAKAGSPNKVLDHVNSQPIFDSQQKTRAFQMSAHEDYLELDDDVQTNGVASTSVIKGVESHELAKDIADLSGTPKNASISGGKSPVSDPKPSTLLFGTNNEEAVPDGSATAQKVSGFAFPAVPSTSAATCTSTEAGVSSPQSAAEIVKVAEQSDKTNIVPAFSSKMVPLTSSPASATVESVAANDIKQELPSSSMEAADKTDGPGKSDKKSTLLFGDVSKKVGDGPVEASSAKGFFSFGLPSNGATVSNDLSNRIPATMGVSSPVQISSSANYLSPVSVSVTSPSLFSFSNGNAVSFSSSAAPAATVITTVTSGSSSSQSSTSMTAPSVSFGSSFQFGSSAIPSTSAAAVTSASVSASGAKSNQFAFGNATSSVFSAKPSGIANAGNNISGFNSTFETASTENQTAASAVANGSIFGLQASISAVPVSTSIPSFSSQSTSSASSQAFGLNAPSSFNSSTSLFGLSSTVSNPFTSGSTLASNASGSSSVSEPVSSSSNTSSIFGWQSSKPTAPGSMFGSSFQSTGFSVGSTASGTSAAGNSTPIVFGAASSSSAASNSSPFVFGSAPPATSVFSVSSSAPSSTPFPSHPAFGCSTPQAFPFGSTPPSGNNDRMSMEDSMAEDSVQVSTPAAPVFGVPNLAPSSGFAFGTAAPAAGNPFQFGGQPNQIAPQNTPFQPSGSLEFNAGGGGGGGGGAGSFSLGSGGGDKANRRFVKVKKGVRRK